MEFKFQLGQIVKDKITGYKGVVMARTQYITACNTYGVCDRKLDKTTGKRKDWEWFDEPRLEATTEKTISLSDETKDKSGGMIVSPPQR